MLEKFKRIQFAGYAFSVPAQKGMVKMVQKSPKSLDTQVIAELPPKALGSINKLGRPGDSYTEKKLNKLGSVLKKNNELGLRDKYTMSEAVKCIIEMYRSRKSYYQKYMKGVRTPLFKKNTFCGNILADASSVMRTEKYNSIMLFTA